MIDLQHIMKGEPLTKENGVWYFSRTPFDVKPSQRKVPADRRSWSYWRRENYIFLERELRDLPRDFVLLDIGAGQSDFGELTQNFKTCAVDFYPYPGIHVVCNLEEKLPFQDESADIILLTNVLEHMREPNQLLKECYRILKPGGILLGTVPFLIQVHQRPYDFYRYTDLNLKYLFEKHSFQEIFILPVSSIFVSMKNLTTSFFMRRIKEARFNLLLRILWKVVRIGFLLCRPIFEKRSFDENNPLGYLWRAHKL